MTRKCHTFACDECEDDTAEGAINLARIVRGTMKLLLDRVAVVTGVAGGIGAAIARAFVENGAHVIGLDVLDSSRLKCPPDSNSFTYLCADITKPETQQLLVDAVAHDHGHVDILVNNAAIPSPLNAIHEAPEEDWHRVLKVNVLSAAQLTSHLLPLMRGQEGRIINIGSVVSICAAPLSGLYVVSKHAILGLTRSQALEYGGIGINANCILPGGVDTEMLRSNDVEGEFRRHIAARCPIGRLANPAEIANIALFLASSLSSYINGHALVADGGLTISI